MGVKVWLAAAVILTLAAGARAEGRADVDLSGKGWRLWRDEKAAWKEDRLFLPPVDLAKVPTHVPTGGWGTLDTGAGVEVSVPGTAEEYLQTTPGPEGDITGVTWWYREVTIPANENSGSDAHILLQFEAARQRAEVYVNHRLVGYDVVGNTPFEADLSSVAKPGETVQIAVRITDPGGNFDWHDKGLIPWGENRLLMSHGFGGVTGRVHLIVCDPVYVDDLYVQNTPEVRTVNVQATLRNTADTGTVRDVLVEVFEKGQQSGEPVASRVLREVQIGKGETSVTAPMTVASAKLWDMDHPNLYTCRVSLLDHGSSVDAAERQFGFRWFEATGIGKDAMFRLNGKRIVLRTAISWGFFPINGMVGTPEMAEKQIRAAKACGLNMLNFHRCIGEPIILEKADELGLLYYEEPGNYDSGAASKDAFAREMAREKVLRMVKRDRSHPSLIIYSMSNETSPKPDALENYQADMKAMHSLDPSRIVLRSSGLRSALGMDHPVSTKMHMLPFDGNIDDTGWYDDHHAGGPAVWNQSFYRNPNDFYHLVHDPKEILYWGEEGAISTPPRLGLIKQELADAPHLGWDGGMYLAWYQMFDEFLTKKRLRDAFPTVDSLCEAMGNIAIEHQGRKTQVIRINNESDGYAINGWESEILENHSGIVDCFRNPKGDPSLLAYYNQPLYVAVMPRTQVLEANGKFIVDFYIVNERDLRGQLELEIMGKDASGTQTFTRRMPVTVAGGDTYGQLLVQGVEIPVSSMQGFFHVEATLEDASHEVKATGRDDVFVTDWESAPITGKGAILETGTDLRAFLEQRKHVSPATYRDDLERVDWILATTPPDTAISTTMPAGPLLSAEKVLDRVEQDRTTLILLDHAAEWMPLIAKRDPAIHYGGAFAVGRTWAGGDHFVRAHPLFKDLPVNCGMNWPYQAVVENGDNRTGLLVDGDELAAGAFHANTPLAKEPDGIHLGTAVGVIRLGKGRVVFSTLDVAAHLKEPEGPADVARKLVCNFLAYAMEASEDGR